MFRSILLLLLINTSYHSLGNPINPTASVSVVHSLTALAGHCANSFLSKQIKNKITSCSDPASPHGEKQLQCLIFYDINKQLCEAIAVQKLVLDVSDEEFIAKINEEQDANSLCLTAKDWVFSNLTEYLRYKQTVDKVFKHPVSCSKICGVEDFMSDDSNYFCKYFRWGSDLLRQFSAISTQDNTAGAQLPPEPTEKPADSVPLSSDLQDVQVDIKNSSSTKSDVNAPTISNTPIKNSVVGKPDLVKPETSSLAVNHNSQSSPSTVNTAVAPDKPVIADLNAGNVEDTGAMPDSANTNQDQLNKSPEEQPPPKPEEVSAQEFVNKPETLEDTQLKPDDHKAGEDKDLQLSEIKPVLKEKPQNEVDDYQDPEDGKEGLSDMQGGDDGDADDPLLGDLDTKLEAQKPDVKKTETMETSLISDKEPFYPNTVQEAFSEDDDHFFPFFLTAIILVVLLYVLYHNKNKVGKVFFGLVLEGRAGTRRRNSRGHAYRRLDTLEQAMSASGAAPPSKIIY